MDIYYLESRDQLSRGCLVVETLNILADIMENSERSAKELKIINDELEEDIEKNDLEIDDWIEKIRELEAREAEERAGRDVERHQGRGN